MVNVNLLYTYLLLVSKKFISCSPREHSLYSLSNYYLVMKYTRVTDLKASPVGHHLPTSDLFELYIEFSLLLTLQWMKQAQNQKKMGEISVLTCSTTIEIGLCSWGLSCSSFWVLVEIQDAGRYQRWNPEIQEEFIYFLSTGCPIQMKNFPLNESLLLASFLPSIKRGNRERMGSK